MATGAGSPCGACKFLRRKCASDCIFAPYFCSDQGPARFAAIHKVFGASNVSKLLSHVPVHDRCEAVVTITYEAQARLRDPVYGCVAHIFALQQQVTCLQAQLMQVKAQLAHVIAENQWRGNAVVPAIPETLYQHSTSPQSSLDCVDHHNFEALHEMYCKMDTAKRRAPHNTDLGELQALALRMMRDD
ncbi:LOB domain-containing protein 16 [Acorus gramineus]|uniref:LOB domain-containing protein 16 n=1 Tax=Acorus gramineus TaxID=55184 RepID=A0AAV9AA23_ACOGR|nr:LOB domain-containing protein 16 [Acorus gramineus]